VLHAWNSQTPIDLGNQLVWSLLIYRLSVIGVLVTASKKMHLWHHLKERVIVIVPRRLDRGSPRTIIRVYYPKRRSSSIGSIRVEAPPWLLWGLLLLKQRHRWCNSTRETHRTRHGSLGIYTVWHIRQSLGKLDPWPGSPCSSFAARLHLHLHRLLTKTTWKRIINL
jgi:hypothetical protein